jgi:hypothetical protein
MKKSSLCKSMMGSAGMFFNIQHPTSNAQHPIK